MTARDYPNLDPFLRHQAQGFDMLIDAMARPARRVAERPADPPQPPDLLAELRQCAIEIDEAASLIRPQFPQVSTLYETAARRVRATIARAEEARS